MSDPIVLLLGGFGQLGTDIRKAITDKGWPEPLMPPRNHTAYDLAEPDAMAKAQWPPFDVLINCAAFHRTDDVERDASRAFQVNAHSVRDLARVCELRKARLIHISTDYVFGGYSSPQIAAAHTENSPTAPVNVYGASKLVGENLIRQVSDRHTIVRVASLFGTAGSSGKGGNFIETMRRLAREQKPIRVVNDQIMSPTYTAHAAAAIVFLIDQGIRSTYHVVNTGRTSWYGLACAALSGIDAKIEPCSTVEMPTPAMRPRFSALSNDRLTTLGFTLPEWHDAVKEYLTAKGR